jgi:hypothetical protein
LAHFIGGIEIDEPSPCEKWSWPIGMQCCKNKIMQQFPDQTKLTVDPTENKAEPIYSQLRGRK